MDKLREWAIHQLLRLTHWLQGQETPRQTLPIYRVVIKKDLPPSWRNKTIVHGIIAEQQAPNLLGKMVKVILLSDHDGLSTTTITCPLENLEPTDLLMVRTSIPVTVKTTIAYTQSLKLLRSLTISG